MVFICLLPLCVLVGALTSATVQLGCCYALVSLALWVRSSVPIDTVPEQVRLGDGQYTTVTCISDSHNLTIQVCRMPTAVNLC
jgi:hypothetical protein